MLQLLISHPNPGIAARNLDDRHVAKGILDSVQILCTSMDLLGCWNRAMYRPRDENCATVNWAVRSKNNLRWVYHYTTALADEWQFRHQKVAAHGCRLVAEICWETFKGHPECQMYNDGLTPFANYTPFEDMEAIPAFQRYLAEKKFDATSTWTGRSKPLWYQHPGIYKAV